MRVPQRSFVVEFKSRSRQTKASKPPSIWGDTDLKAVARQVEKQSAHLFDPPADKLVCEAAASQLERSLAVPTSLECPTSSAGSETQLANTQRVVGALTDTGRKKVAAKVRSETVEKPPVPPVTPDPQSMPLRKTKPLGVRSKREAAPRMPFEAGVKEKGFVSAAKLAALEEENRRLKTLLREHLQAENAHLAAMLLRFL